jgi:peptide/nickel transport system permease protein
VSLLGQVRPPSRSGNIAPELLTKPSARRSGVRQTRFSTSGRGAVLGRLVWRRLFWAVPLVGGVSLAVFWLLSVSPFDSASAILGARVEFAGAEVRADLETLLGTQPWWSLWLDWAANALRGDWGVSTSLRSPVASILISRIPWTVLLMAAGFTLALFAAVPLALIAAWRPGGAVDRIITGVSWALSALPAFVVGLGLLSVFALTLRWLPSGGSTSPLGQQTMGQVAIHLVLPAVAVALSQLPWMVLHLKASLDSHVISDARNGARLRGLSERRILLLHTLPASLGPIVALSGTRLPELLTGALLVEQVFSWPGMGQALVGAALANDYALLAGSTAGIVVLGLLGNLLADSALVLIDPRIDGDAL